MRSVRESIHCMADAHMPQFEERLLRSLGYLKNSVRMCSSSRDIVFL